MLTNEIQDRIHNMEKFKDQKQEKTLKDAATEAIKFLGIDDPDAKAVLQKWKDEEDKEIKLTPIEDQLDAEIHSLIYEAEIYFNAGYPKKAIECLEEAQETALNDKLLDVIPKISDKIEEYKNS